MVQTHADPMPLPRCLGRYFGWQWFRLRWWCRCWQWLTVRTKISRIVLEDVRPGFEARYKLTALDLFPIRAEDNARKVNIHPATSRVTLPRLAYWSFRNGYVDGIGWWRRAIGDDRPF